MQITRNILDAEDRISFMGDWINAAHQYIIRGELAKAGSCIQRAKENAEIARQLIQDAIKG